MRISSKIRQYKKAVDGLNVSELLAALNNSRLTVDERYAIELVDLYSKSLKEAANEMDTDMRQVNRWLHKARIKVLKQIFK